VRLGQPSAPDVNDGQGVTSTFAPCIVQGNVSDVFGGERFPQIFADP
jgi:hypothetical protein